jgi:hypothetical protein
MLGKSIKSGRTGTWTSGPPTDLCGRWFSQERWRRAVTATEGRDKSWFLADLDACDNYLRRLGLEPICDSAVRALLLGNLDTYKRRKHCREHLDVLGRVPVLHTDRVMDEVTSRPEVVWISVGSQLGPAWRKDAPGVVRPGRLFGVASCSALNDGYNGLKLCPWVLEPPGPGAPLVRFLAGQMTLDFVPWSADSATSNLISRIKSPTTMTTK